MGEISVQELNAAAKVKRASRSAAELYQNILNDDGTEENDILDEDDTDESDEDVVYGQDDSESDEVDEVGFLDGTLLIIDFKIPFSSIHSPPTWYLEWLYMTFYRRRMSLTMPRRKRKTSKRTLKRKMQRMKMTTGKTLLGENSMKR